MSATSVLVVGAGVFGLTTALELKLRGHDVTVVDPGPIPHPLAASTDISKVIRMEYGPDETYMALAERAREGWLAWNEMWAAHGKARLYHETGVLMLCREPMRPGGFEYESFELLLKRGHSPERMDAETLARRFPAWRAGRYVDGFFDAKGGYAESGLVVRALSEDARRAGITFLEGRVRAIAEEGGRITGVIDEDGHVHAADRVVLAAGAWTGKVLGALETSIVATGHPVFHLRPSDPASFRAEWFPTFTADVSQTGYYGFPLHRTEGVVKIANHGLGVRVDPDADRLVSRREHERLRAFLADTFPALTDAEIVFTRLCLYADTPDEDFWIARHPEYDGLTVASGGSGHGFKFAPVLGAIVADAVEGASNPWLERFRWRADGRRKGGREAARAR